MSHQGASIANSKKRHLGELVGELAGIFKDMKANIDKGLGGDLQSLFDNIKDMIENRGGISLNGEDFTFCESKDGAFMVSTYVILSLTPCQQAKMKKLSFVAWPIEKWSLYTITSTLENLLYLKLHDCKLGPDHCKTLADSLQGNKSIIELDLSYNRLIGIHAIRSDVKGGVDVSGLKLLFAALLASNYLQILDLSGNYLGGIRCTSASSDKEIVRSIDNCGEVVAHIIGIFLRHTRSLKSLNLNSNEFCDNEKIQKILLSSNHDYACDRVKKDADSVLCYNSKEGSKIDCDDDTNSSIYNNTNEDINTHKMCNFPIQLESSSSSSSSSSLRPSLNNPTPHNLFPSLSPSCQTLCGITLINSKDVFMHSKFENSNFNSAMGDTVDMSNLSLDPFTGRLLGRICIYLCEVMYMFFFYIFI
jgi:hypothetical protein